MRAFTFSFVLIFLLTSCSENNDPQKLFNQGDYVKSLPLWRAQANKGDAQAQNYVGIHYYLGLGTGRNYKKAKEWFEKSAIQGNADAQYNFGVMYENGEFVKQDYTTAYMWFYLANENGNSHASGRMKGLAEEHKLFPNQMRHAAELSRKYLNKTN